MCGIFAYTGTREAAPVLLEGLRMLEYRGYDSAGIHTSGGGMAKAVGAVDELQKKITGPLPGTSGISHLRWATHGEPSELNAHPHTDCSQGVWLVHNGIIENYAEIKEGLLKKGHIFTSETDTEVLAHLIEEHLKEKKNLEKAVIAALNVARGAYALTVSWTGEPRKLIAARMSAPIVLGIGEGENFIASDPSPILPYTKNVVYLEDGEVAAITPEGYTIYDLESSKVDRDAMTIEWTSDQAKKGGYEHFMLKEIMEGPEVLKNAIRGRIVAGEGRAKLGGLEEVRERLREVKRIIIVACGSAYYAGLAGKYMLEELAGIPTEIEIGSEFRYREIPFVPGTAVLAVSQSGETADTLASIKEAKKKGLLTLGIVNAVGSTIARETDAGIYNHAGPEIGVASTKAFISELAVFALLAAFLGRDRAMSRDTASALLTELAFLPGKIDAILDTREAIREAAMKYKDFQDFLYVGRKYNFPIAYEGALKLKEISYVHAEGCGAGEMKHGPIAMIEPDFPTVAIAPRDSVYEKMLSNMQEIKARQGRILAIATEGDASIAKIANDVIYIPETLEMLTPILSVVVLQLFAYYIGVSKGYNVDRPRNLAKSVTVE